MCKNFIPLKIGKSVKEQLESDLVLEKTSHTLILKEAIETCNRSQGPWDPGDAGTYSCQRRGTCGLDRKPAGYYWGSGH